MTKTQAFHSFLKSNEVYRPEQIKYVIDIIKPYLDTVKKSRMIDGKKEQYSYYNIPVSFDIETTSFFRSIGKDREKTAIMYEWTFGIFGLVIIGRTWNEFINMLEHLTEELNISEDMRIVVYVHNLSFEFQFIRKYFEWSNVFALEVRKPVYAVTTTGIEFRCSYILSGYNLETCAKNLQQFDIEKLVGDLDYTLIRHSGTPLTDKELQYCINDVKIVMAYIFECIENDGNIARIPLTQTGYVRNYCRKQCLSNTPDNKYKRFQYQRIIKGLKITSVEEYAQLQRAFMGGFTHANPFYANKTLNNITSFDFTSSYPTVMIAEKFPMSTAERVEIRSKEQFEENLKNYCCLFDVRFKKIEPVLWCDNYISESRCSKLEAPIINNGRVVTADLLETTITEQDFMIIKRFYKWEHMEIGLFHRYKKAYLPKSFVKSILKLYADKTTLKNVDGQESEYIKAKQMLNSAYGMCVTSIIRDLIEYTDDWQEPSKPNVGDKIEEYNKDSNRFLFFPWGVWVTTYARRNLFTGITEFNEDYVYSDTDSIKVMNVEKHSEYIEKYNSWIISRLKEAMKHHRLPNNLIEPETIEGIKKPLGVWDFDGHYSRFKTLGAKRYLVEYSKDKRNGKSKGKILLTVSGLNKKEATPYLLRKHGSRKVFDKFNDDLYIPCGQTGKLTHTYIDVPMCGEITDYLGETLHYNELSAVHLCDSDYSLKLSRKYRDYILDIQTR